MDPIDAGAPPIVGRDAELTELLAALVRAEAGRPGAVLVTGDAGVGKTRLVRAAAELARVRGARVLVGHCLDLGDVGMPFLPVAEVLSDLVDGLVNGLVSSLDDGGDDAVRRALERRPVLARLSPAVEGLLGRSSSASSSPPQVGSDRLALFEALEGLLADLAPADGAVVLVLEDLHWADASTRDLLRFLLARLRAGRLVVLGSVRAEDLHRRHPLRPLLAELGRLSAVRRLELRPLPTDALVEHLRHLEAGAGRSEAQLAAVAARSEGNPYYAEELLASTTAGGPGLSDVLLGPHPRPRPRRPPRRRRGRRGRPGGVRQGAPRRPGERARRRPGERGGRRAGGGRERRRARAPRRRVRLPPRAAAGGGPRRPPPRRAHVPARRPRPAPRRRRPRRRPARPRRGAGPARPRQPRRPGRARGQHRGGRRGPGPARARRGAAPRRAGALAAARGPGSGRGGPGRAAGRSRLQRPAADGGGGRAGLTRW
ncbi:MAG: AAA family ATPase [Quadrisphaera sp.]